MWFSLGRYAGALLVARMLSAWFEPCRAPARGSTSLRWPSTSTVWSMKTNESIMDSFSARRVGDTIEIDGAYQHRALTDGPAIQRFWHHEKLLLLDWYFPLQRSDRVLDVGCGSGVFAAAMAERCAQVLGVDANPRAISYARQTFRHGSLAFRHGLLDELALPEVSFDKVTVLEIIEHVYLEQVNELFRSLYRLLSPGGEVLVTTPNYRGTWPVIEWAADRFSRAAQMDSAQHVTRFHRGLLIHCLRDAGFEVDRIRTYCTLAPFVALGSWRLAESIERVERRVDFPFGNLLAAVARKPLRG